MVTAALLPLQAIVDDPRPPVYSGHAASRFDGAITLRGVTFGYGLRPVLREIDLEVGAGQRVAVVGPNGAGSRRSRGSCWDSTVPGPGR